MLQTWACVPPWSFTLCDFCKWLSRFRKYLSHLRLINEFKSQSWYGLTWGIFAQPCWIWRSYEPPCDVQFDLNYLSKLIGILEQPEMLAQVGDLLPALRTRISGLEVDDGNVGKRQWRWRWQWQCWREIFDSEAQTLKWTNLVCESWLDFLSVL